MPARVYLDVPGILKGASKGLGRGKEVLSVARSADLILIFVDVFNPDAEGLIEELHEVGIRVDKTPPDVIITKQETGGVVINRIRPTRKLKDKNIVDILGVYGIHSAIVTIRDDIDVDEFIDVIVGNRIYTKSLKVVNKIDMVDKKRMKAIEKKMRRGFRVSEIIGHATYFANVLNTGAARNELRFIRLKILFERLFNPKKN